MNSKSKILLGILLILVTLSITASYYRFMVLHDYIVGYEGNCDPYTQHCFIGCEDDECTIEYYYSQVQKYAPNLYEQCGQDTTDCESAHTCLPEDGERCIITFCSPEDNLENCEILTEEDFVGEEAEIFNTDNDITNETGTVTNSTAEENTMDKQGEISEEINKNI